MCVVTSRHRLYGRLKACKLVHQSMQDYLTEIQTTCDSLANSGHPISEMQQISIVLNGVKGQSDNIIDVIHTNRNPNDITSVSFVLLDARARQGDMIFDSSISAKVVVDQTPMSDNCQDNASSMSQNVFKQVHYVPELPHASKLCTMR